MRAQRDRDLLLVETMLAPPPLKYWERRHKALPLHAPDRRMTGADRS
jgi:hypothetical protein